MCIHYIKGTYLETTNKYGVHTMIEILKQDEAPIAIELHSHTLGHVCIVLHMLTPGHVSSGCRRERVHLKNNVNEWF